MATKKKAVKKSISPNTDARNVAYGQLHELKYVCTAHVNKITGIHPTVKKLKAIMRNLGTTSRPKRSREKLYLVLKGMGYVRYKPSVK